MRRTTRSVALAFVGIASFSLMISPVSAGHSFEKLSKNHLQFGVSQFLAGNVPNSRPQNLKLMNPNHVTQVAAVLIYERVKENPSFGPIGEAELFLGCAVRELSPHAAVGISSEEVGDTEDFTALYVEVISAPATPVKRKTGKWLESWNEREGNEREGKERKGLRLADGLGIIADASGSEKSLHLIHPGLFSLPSDDVVDGQQQAAIDCVCAALDELPDDSDLEVFEDFGIDCPG